MPLTKTRGLGGSGLFGVLIAGDLFHTTLRQGEYTTRRVHRFDDTSAEFQRMVSNTLHPVGQLGPCACRSGKRYVDCCLAPQLDKPCVCGSGETLAACCSVYATPQRDQVTATLVDVT